MRDLEAQQPGDQVKQRCGGGAEGAEMPGDRAVSSEQSDTDNDGLLVTIQPSTARMNHLHEEPPKTKQTSVQAGQIPVRPETNTRASRQVSVITKQGAIRHPGQSHVQAHGTK